MKRSRPHARRTAQRQPRLLRRLAAKVFWWKTPEEALRNPARFVAQVMTHGDWSEVQATRRYFGESAFLSVLRDPPPGILDRRSWAYWHTVLGKLPAPELPRRRLP
jgi:hypothetical protein